MRRVVTSLSLLSKSKRNLLQLPSNPVDSTCALDSWSNSKTGMQIGYITQLGVVGVQFGNSNYSTRAVAQMPKQCSPRAMTSSEVQSDVQAMHQQSRSNAGGVHKLQIGANVSKKDKTNFLIKTLYDLKGSKEAVYGALDAWVAWEQNFPIVSLKRALLALEKDQQWHRVVQVIKWMLSKGQGTTVGSYGQLIRALDMDDRAEEAHKIWVKKIGNDLHSVPWQLCKLMISIYYRNNMLDRLVELFKGLEAFDRKPPEKSIVQKVANAYEMLGLLEEQQRILEKYNSLFIRTFNGRHEKSKKASKKKTTKSEAKNRTGISDNLSSVMADAQAS